MTSPTGRRRRATSSPAEDASAGAAPVPAEDPGAVPTASAAASGAPATGSTDGLAPRPGAHRAAPGRRRPAGFDGLAPATGGDAPAGALVPRPRSPGHHHAVVVEDDEVAEVEAALEAGDLERDDEPPLDLSGSPVADLITSAWETYQRTGDRQLRERLILHYAPLVTAVAHRVGARLPRTVEHADLVSAGMFGLIEAIERFEPGRGIRFEAYAGARVRGAIIDDLRATDWIPRSVRSKARAVDRAYAELEGELRRTPTEPEVAERLGMSLGELHTVFSQISTVNVAALDEMLGADRGSVSFGDTLTDHSTPDPAGSFETRETKNLLARAIDGLGEREKIVLVLYYYENFTLAEIGRVLGVTESRISQMHKGAMRRLRTSLVEAGHG